MSIKINKNNIIFNLVAKKKIEDISKKMPFTEYGSPAIIEDSPDKFPKYCNSFRITDGKYILLNKTISIPASGTYTIIFWLRCYAYSNDWAYVFGPQSYNFPIIGINQSSANINGDNKWHQLCLTKDSSGIVRYFIDGIIRASTSGRNYAQSIDMIIGGNVSSQAYYDCANVFMTTDLLYTENFTPESFLPLHNYLYSNLKTE